MASSGESAAHKQLKRSALKWAQVQGFSVGALEVRVPNSNYRADAVAYRPGRQSKKDAGFSLGQTVLFECKQSRPDFLNDGHPELATRERLMTCRARLSRLSRLLGTHQPHLRKGDSLFPEYESHDFSGLAHAGYEKLVNEIRVLESRLYGKTKFSKLVRYSSANFLYLVVLPGIVSEQEVPLDWGLLEENETGELICLRPAVLIESPELHRLQLLERIGFAATKAFNKSAKISFEEIRESRRNGPIRERPR